MDQHPPNSAAEARTADAVNVLLVDDQPQNLVALEALLAAPGRNLIKAASGREALRQVLVADFALILLDVKMPEMDGFEIAELIRERERSSRTPIIFLTAVYTGEPEIFRGYALGAVDYVLKPVRPEILQFKVSVFVELARQKELIKRQAEELARSKELARPNAELERFAHMSAHDLREPLRTVSGLLGLLKYRYQGVLDAKGNQVIDQAVSGAKRMARLLDDLLSFNLSSRAEVHLQSTECETVFQQSLRDLQAAIQESGAVVTSEPLPTLMAEPATLGLLFQNLLANAIKFHGLEPPRVHVSAEKKGNEWLFSVSDNGIGIEPEHWERVFQIFERLHTREEYPGSGIGLATCRKIVQRHGGRIWVESEAGKGTTFRFAIQDRC